MLRQFDDCNPYLRGLIVQCGFPSTGIAYTWRSRKKGLSKSNLAHLIDTGLNGILSFTKLPMRLCMFIGGAVAAPSMLYAFIGLIGTLISPDRMAPPGIATLIVAVFFFSGFQLFFLGVIGEYIAAIFNQVRKQPLVVEKEVLNFVPRVRGRKRSLCRAARRALRFLATAFSASWRYRRVRCKVFPPSPPVLGGEGSGVRG